MKKILALILAMVMMLGLVACGGGEAKQTEAPKKEDAPLVDAPEAVEVTVDEPNEEGVVVYHLHVGPDDMGRVIGRQGRIAKAIRTVMRAAAIRRDVKVQVDID